MKTLLSILCASTMLSTAYAADSLVVVSFGGSYGQALRMGTQEPWMQETGNHILQESYNGGLAEIKSQVESDNVSWDVVDLGAANAIRACDEGLIEPFDLSSLPPAPDGTLATSDFMKNAATPCTVPFLVVASVLSYDATRFESAPQSWADFWDVEQFPGKRGLRSRAEPTLLIALLADGVPEDQLSAVLSTPEGQARAFAKLDQLRPHIVWWESASQTMPLLDSGEVSMTSTYNGRVFAAQQDDKPFEIVWRDHIYDYEHWAIVKGSPNYDLAVDYIRHATSTEAQINQSRYISYGATRHSASAVSVTFHADDSINMIDHMPSSPQNLQHSHQKDHEFWANYEEELNERFAVWLAK